MNRLVVIVRGLGSALVLAMFVAGVPAVLVGIGAFPDSVPDLPTVWRALTGPDTSGRAVFAVLAAIVWLLWAAFTTSVLREIGAAFRTRGHRPVRPVRPVAGLTWSARPAALLVTAIVAMFVAAPLLAATAPHAAAAGHPSGGDRGDSGVGHRPTSTSSAVQRPGPATGSRQLAAANVGQSSQGAVVSSHQAVPADHESGAATATPAGAHRRYTVRRHDSLWSIAERQLGDPLRYREIAALNPHLGPDYEIRAGDVLSLPAFAAGDHQAGDLSNGDATHVAVQKGDTLSGIAAEHGIPDWHTVWAANAGKLEPGGKRFTNPDHIEVNWDISVPAGASAAPAASGPATSASSTPPPAATTTAPPTPAPPVPPTPAPPGPPTPAATSRHDPPEPAQPNPAQGGQATAREATPSPVVAPSSATAERTLLPSAVGFAGGGAILAAGVFGALALTRRQQFRDRRPGRTIASTGPDLVPVERATVTIGGPAAAESARIHEVLRRVAATDADTLHVAAVQLSGGNITIHLASPVALADPWRSVDAAGLEWMFPAAADTDLAGADPDEVGAIAPYPTLVHIGSDATSSWLLNLEQAGGLVLTGDSRRCRDLARVMAGQLGLTPWGETVFTTLVGFGQELIDAAPDWLRYAPPDRAQAALADAARFAVSTADYADLHEVDVVKGRREAVMDEIWAPKVWIVGADAADTTDAGAAETDEAAAPATVTLAGLLELLQTRKGTTGTAVVVVGAEEDSSPPAGTMVARLHADGTLSLPTVGLTVAAPGWDEDTARGVGMLLQHARTAPDEKVPDATGDQPWQTFSDAAGALRDELVQPRATPNVHDSTKPATHSMLPLADQVYLDAAATTKADLQTLAPNVPADVRPKIEEADPTLEADVADWLDQSSPRAKLRMLGPLTLKSDQPAPERAAFFAELTAYLTAHQHGVSVGQVATAFNVAEGSARKYVMTVRGMLGTNPQTGHAYLPDADKSEAAKVRGVNIYQITGLLVDADLFRRLRVRGQARGQHGIEDLSPRSAWSPGSPSPRCASAVERGSSAVTGSTITSPWPSSTSPTSSTPTPSPPVTPAPRGRPPTSPG
jgi:LysM repeat protein